MMQTSVPTIKARGTALNNAWRSEVFYKKHEASEILLQEGGAIYINDLPFLTYQDIGKGHLMIASPMETDTERDVVT